VPRLEKTEAKEAIGRRLAQECSRLKLSQSAAAAIVGCSRRSWGYYESGSSSLDSLQLALLDPAGFDVLYIVTGRRSRRVGIVERPNGGKALALPAGSI
jgi:transcriptional regulator with XRE-family HTH domain